MPVKQFDELIGKKFYKSGLRKPCLWRVAPEGRTCPEDESDPRK